MANLSRNGEARIVEPLLGCPHVHTIRHPPFERHRVDRVAELEPVPGSAATERANESVDREGYLVHRTSTRWRWPRTRGLGAARVSDAIAAVAGLARRANGQNAIAPLKGDETHA